VKVVRANGLEIAYERLGKGPPLVFVHGAAEDARAWKPQLAGLAGEFTVVAWDEPGAGRSSDLPERFGLADYADCLAALIEALGLSPRTSPACLGEAPSCWSSTAAIPGWWRP
jgi:pimeloyl-ACP methyl ester carboxylesterase